MQDTEVKYWPPAGINWYYVDSAVAICHGDCRDILPLLQDVGVDLVLTDPPYGVGIEYERYDDTRDNWAELMDFIIPWGIAHSKAMILPCARMIELPHIYKSYPPDWLICWYKGSTPNRAWTGFNDWEPHLVYGKIKGTQYHDYFFALPFHKGNFKHPCPKPERWANYLISRASLPDNVICDPFLGSGTTAYCAKRLNRKCIGIEIEERYAEISAKRCSQSVMELGI